MGHPGAKKGRERSASTTLARGAWRLNGVAMETSDSDGKLPVLKVDFDYEITGNFTGILLFPDETKSWYLNGLLHREDGPAREWGDGSKEWWLNGWFAYTNYPLLNLNNVFIVIERGIPSKMSFGKIKVTEMKLLTAAGTLLVPENLPGMVAGENNG